MRHLSSGCRGTKRSSTLPAQVLRKLKPPLAVQVNVKPTLSRSIRVTGRLDRGINPDTVHKKHCIMIWALNYWNTVSRGLMHVFWLVSRPNSISPAVRSLTGVTGQYRRSDWYGPPCCCCKFGLFIDSKLPQGSGKSYRSVPSVLDPYTIA